MNESIRYLLSSSFEYEIRNGIEVRITEINQNKDTDLSEQESDELKTLIEVKEYLQKRIAEMRK